MESLFVSYEIALALKELGFDEPCMATTDQIEYVHIKGTKSAPRGSMMYDTIDCPSYSQAFRFFREKYNLLCVVFNDDGDIEHDNLRYNWEIRVVTRSFKDMKNEKNACVGDYNYKTYEEAELECLKQMIEIIKKK